MNEMRMSLIDYVINVYEFIKWFMNAGWLSRSQLRKVELLEEL